MNTFAHDQGHACNTTICAILPSWHMPAGHNIGIPNTFENICQFYEALHDKKSIKTIHLGLGDCNTLLDPDSK